MCDQRGFFDLDERYAALSTAGDPLERLSSVIDFGIFRPEPDAALKRGRGKKRPDVSAMAETAFNLKHLVFRERKAAIA